MYLNDVTEPFSTVESGGTCENKVNCLQNICKIFNSCNLKCILPYIFLAIILITCFCKKK